MNVIYILLISATLTWFCGRKAFSFYNRYTKSPLSERLSSGMFVFVGGLGGLLIFGISTYSLTVRVNDGSMTVRNGQIVAVFEKLTIPWRWDERIEGAEIISYEPTQSTVAMSANPITANPEVLELDFDVTLEVGGSPDEMLAYVHSDWYNQVEFKLKYLLYEFRKQYHGRMTPFWNPLEEQQQWEFKSLIRPFIEPHLSGKGIKFLEARFVIPDPASRRRPTAGNARAGE